MRRFVLRCFVVLLSLALISGNAHAELHLGAMPHDPCPAELGHDHHGGSHHRHDKDRSACCCDCLGCVSAIEVMPDLSNTVPVSFSPAVFYGEGSLLLAGRVLRPDPGPPRTGALS
jgi:hypothetical protein